VLGIEELESLKRNGPIREQLVTWSAATGQQTAVPNNLNVRKRSEFEQILYTNADGSVLVLTTCSPARTRRSCTTAARRPSPGPATSPTPPGSRTPLRTVARVIADQTPV
jgi:hypothetical protein